mmetsp:Transcript_3247/g.5440  ORF Transcript_3247/g.5440 Transcript_3247/m.5440 type:complete len:379 (+) Transcript_3247:160-1296(+)
MNRWHRTIGLSRAVFSHGPALRLAGASLPRWRSLSLTHGLDAMCNQDRQHALVEEMTSRGLISEDRLGIALRAVDRGLFHVVEEGEPLEDLDYVYGVDSRPVQIDTDEEAAKRFPLSAAADHALQLAELSKWLFPGAKVFDCGAGSGYLSAVMAILVAGHGAENGGIFAAERQTVWTTAAVPRLAKALQQAAEPNPALDQPLVDEGVLGRLMLMPTDGVDPVFYPKAPYDAIRVSFALPSEDGEEVKNLLAQLKRGGRMIAHVGNDPVLRRFDKDMDGKVTISLGSTPSSFVPALVQRRVAVEPDTESPEKNPANVKEQRAADGNQRTAAQVQAELKAWREAFEREHGRRPSRHDMAADAKAAALFREFSALHNPDPI